jgi:ribonuclease III
VGSNVVPLSEARRRQLDQLVSRLNLGATGRLRWDLLDLALIHPSMSADRNYEHLEFVGDAVVRLATAEFLTEVYGEAKVGDLAAIRSVLVSDRTLAEIAKDYGFDRYLLVASSAAGDLAGASTRLADSLEAVMAALYLSCQDLSLVRPWLDPHWRVRAEEIRQDPARQNYKAALQEWTQAHYKQLPEYQVTELNVAHGDRERFSATVWLQGQCLGAGTGHSIKAAQQAAAKVAFLAFAPAASAPNSSAPNSAAPNPSSPPAHPQ